MRNSILLNLLRLYGLHFPLRKGKGLLAVLGLKLAEPRPQKFIVPAKDGRLFRVDLTEGMYHDLYFRGVYEPDVTEVMKKVIRPGDIIFDLGANFGWYTTLFSSLVGSTGTVHCFEPVPWIYGELCANLELNRSSALIVHNQLAVGNREAKVAVYVFTGLPHGHSSLSTLGRNDFLAYESFMTTLDVYVCENGIKTVALIKCDVEGAEMLVLEGSQSLLSSQKPPMWLMEINTETSKAFGYRPSDLLAHLNKFGYEFYKVEKGRAVPHGDLNGWRHGDHVLCVIPSHHASRLGKGKRRQAVQV